MTESEAKVTATKTLVYLLLILVACTILSLNISGTVDIVLVIILFFLTFPWSLVTILFLWALLHEAGLGILSYLYFLFAIINVILFLVWRYFIQRKITNE